MSQDINLNSLYIELCKCEVNDEYEKALKLTDKILSRAQNDETAFHCKIVSLIRLSKFKDCLPYFENDKRSENLVLEKAYCYYRLNQPENALTFIKAGKESNLNLKELEAQILYRLERYEESFNLYRQIIKNSHDEYENERSANFAAVMSFLPSKQSKDLPLLEERTYELLYNIACCLVEQGSYSEAYQKLKLSEKLCREYLEEDGCSEEDIFEETSIIRGQQAYCLQMMGNEKEAQQIYSSILRQKPKDIGLIAITSNNSMAINEDQNIFDMKKKLRSFSVDGLEYKLTKKQMATILLNQCLFTMSTNQYNQCVQLCDKLIEKYPEMKEDVIVIQALVLSQQKKRDEAVNLLLDYAKDSSSSSQLKIKLTAAQILIIQGKKQAACDILENTGDAIYKPGIISILVALYTSLGQKEKATKFLEVAVDWHFENKNKDIDISPLLRQIAEFHLQNGDPRVAAKCLDGLLRLKPNDTKIIAKLVIAYAQFDEKKAMEYSKHLPELKTDDIDIETVLRSNWTKQTKLKKALAKVENSPQHNAGYNSAKTAAEPLELIDIKVKKKKRKRKPKLPKSYDPNVEPDPNRWLPKHERTGIRKKRDRRIKDNAIRKGTQGAAGASSDQYDITKMASQSPKPAQNAATSGPRTQQHNNRFQQRKQQKKKRR